jgi:hypothetical protein
MPVRSLRLPLLLQGERAGVRGLPAFLLLPTPKTTAGALSSAGCRSSFCSAGLVYQTTFAEV